MIRAGASGQVELTFCGSSDGQVSLPSRIHINVQGLSPSSHNLIALAIQLDILYIQRQRSVVTIYCNRETNTDFVETKCVCTSVY